MKDNPNVFRDFINLSASLLIIFSVAGCSEEHPGEALYVAKCSQCHSISGDGLRELYPPLHKSAFFDQQINLLPCLIHEGSIFLQPDKGVRRTGFMPPIRSLTREELVDLLDYLQHHFGNRTIAISTSDIDTWLSSCGT